MSEDELLVDVSDGIGTVTFHRPHVRNALTGSLVTAVRQALADLDADPDVAVLVLTGTDPAFCAGLDLKALAAGDPVLVGAATESSVPSTARASRAVSSSPWPATSWSPPSGRRSPTPTPGSG
jgi:enoyl-CoA hydratase